MQRLGKLLTTSIGKKMIMALTGLALVGFLIVHLLGNLTLFVSDEAFADYAAVYEHNAGLVYLAEVGLIVVFLVHVGLALRTSQENREAKHSRYAIRASMGKKTTGSSSMLITGAIIGVFIIIHLLDFRLDSEKSADRLATMVRERLTEPVGITIYLVGVIAVGIHVSHAFKSAFQTLGLNHPKYNPLIHWTGLALSLVLGLGFAAFPVLIGAPAEAETAAVEAPALQPSSTDAALEGELAR